jgi:hypothetical protein
MLKTAKKDRVLYEFIIKKPVEKTIEISEKDTETGEEIVRKKKVETVEEINIRCLRPTRKNIEEAEFQYSLKLSECLNMGIMTKQMLYKKYTDTGGLYTNEIFKELTERYERQVEIKELFTLLSSTLSDKEDDELTEEEKNKIQELQKLIPEYGKNYQRILEIESEYDTLFTHTADKLAENHKLRYFIIKGTQIKNPGEEDYKDLYEVPVDTVTKKIEFNDQVEKYLDLEDEDDPIYFQILEKVQKVYGLYFYRADVLTKEQFTEAMELLEKNEQKEKDLREKAQKLEMKQKIEEAKAKGEEKKSNEEAVSNSSNLEKKQERPKRRRKKEDKLEGA